MLTPVRYGAPWGMPVVVATVLVGAGMLAGAAAAAAFAPPPAWPLLALIPASLLWAWAYSPTGYRIENGELVIERPAGSLRVGLYDLRDVQLDPPLGIPIRVFGNGGLFGAWGWFWSRRIGWFQTALRRARPNVLVRTSTRTVLVAPDRPEEFVREIERAAGPRTS
jgi:PH (Pleckstrin Homology) domain-containing protein